VPGASVRCGRAFAPAHVSGIFVPRVEARDPRRRGSVGAGLVLSAGVAASALWRPARRPSVRLATDRPGRFPISEEVARRLGAARPGALTVHLRHDLPIGQGFGSSAAGALATGLAVAEALEIPRRRAVEVAHLADLFGGGGLGGVAAILGGGLEVRVRPGVPPFGRVVRRTVDRPLLVGTIGPPIRSPGVLRDPDRLARFAAAAPLFDRLAAHPTWEAFWSVSERFTGAVRLAPPRLDDVLRGLRRRGARAAQAMFGRSFFAAPPPGDRGADLVRWLRRERVTVRTLRVARRGAGALGANDASE
jgi:pantoate kinase